MRKWLYDHKESHKISTDVLTIFVNDLAHNPVGVKCNFFSVTHKFLGTVCLYIVSSKSHLLEMILKGSLYIPDGWINTDLWSYSIVLLVVKPSLADSLKTLVEMRVKNTFFNWMVKYILSLGKEYKNLQLQFRIEHTI